MFEIGIVHTLLFSNQRDICTDAVNHNNFHNLFVFWQYTFLKSNWISSLHCVEPILLFYILLLIMCNYGLMGGRGGSTHNYHCNHLNHHQNCLSVIRVNHCFWRTKKKDQVARIGVMGGGGGDLGNARKLTFFFCWCLPFYLRQNTYKLYFRHTNIPSCHSIFIDVNDLRTFCKICCQCLRNVWLIELTPQSFPLFWSSESDVWIRVL